MANEFARNRQDADLNPAAKALPAAASTTANTASIDLNAVTPFVAPIELNLNTPSLDSTALPNSETVTYELEHSTDDTTFTDVYILDGALQTGAGGAGDSGGDFRFTLPSDINRYIRVSATTSSSTGDCSGSNMTLTVNL